MTDEKIVTRDEAWAALNKSKVKKLGSVAEDS